MRDLFKFGFNIQLAILKEMQKKAIFVFSVFCLTLQLASTASNVSISTTTPSSSNENYIGKHDAGDNIMNYFSVEYLNLIKSVRNKLELAAENIIENGTLSNTNTKSMNELIELCSKFLEEDAVFVFNGKLDGNKIAEYVNTTRNVAKKLANTLATYQLTYPKKQDKIVKEILENLDFFNFLDALEKRAVYLFKSFGEKVRDYANNTTSPLDYNTKIRWNVWYKQYNGMTQPIAKLEAFMLFAKTCTENLISTQI
ncbi:uncharacterized protein [Eurosta solidaginis]|uniref:uncharacterized protein n=1 Tax=Eurosta solidaginis TaxID=178769 RepID=UPI003531328A